MSYATTDKDNPVNKTLLQALGSSDISPIDEEVALFLAQMRERWSQHPSLSSVSPAEARKIAEIVREPFRKGGPTISDTRELSIPTRHGDMRARLYNPGLGENAPLLIYLHGGGFTLFSIDTHDRLMREYAASARVKVLGLDYYLSPEYKFPVAIEQVEDTFQWLKTASVGVDLERISMGGDSAGGNITMATAIRLRDKDEGTLLKGMLFNYSGFSTQCSDEAEALHGGPGSVMDREEIRYYYRNYTRTAADLSNPEIFLLKAKLNDLPPSFLVIADRDIIAENSYAMADRLEQAGNAVQYKIYKGATHSFLEAMAISRLAREAIADGAAFINGMLNGHDRG
ncbi:hypothetical protein AYJ56_17160 [Brucella anthropi]|nr:hypothetical protein AYJ56_17160 [Brucella anthropi]